MAPHSPTSETTWPAKDYLGRPYDRAAPYDWAAEGIFDEDPVKSGSIMLEGLKKLFVVGSLVVAMNAIAILHDAVDQSGLKEAQKVPATLPAAVKKGIDSAVKVEYAYASHNSFSSVEGSGAKIGPGLVLTAGHVVLKDNPGNNLECAGSSVLSTLDGQNYGNWSHQILNRKAVYDTTYDYTAGQDIALLNVYRDTTFNRLPTARIAASEPAMGTTVFFVNYETGGMNSNVEHYPNTSSADQVAAGKKNYNHPAEYAGTVIGKQGPYLLVATSEAGYGPMAGREVNSYPGASGGEVLNSAGRLIGESVAIQEGGINVSEISNYGGVELQSNPSTRQVSIVQPITQAILKPYLAGLPKNPLC